LYSYPFERFLSETNIDYTKVPALLIKRSSGIIRGKNDKADAKMIAEFGYTNREKLQVTKITDAKLSVIKSLENLRDRYAVQKAGFEATLKEQKAFLGFSKNNHLFKSQQRIIRAIEKELEKTRQEIEKAIESDESMKVNYDLIRTIPGVGPVVATNMIIYTANFTSFTDPRKFASYCGVAPFDNTSGTSIRKRTKVCHLANKVVKRLLDLAAKSAIVYDPELRMFYQRRVAEGKNKMSTINIVRNKILHRIFAVIKRASAYQKNYQQAA
jgi:transposase